MGDLFLFFKNQLRTLVFVSWCYIQCFPCRENLAFGCIRGSDLLQSCASKVRMWPLQALSQGWALAGGAAFHTLPQPREHPTFWEHTLGSQGSVGWRSAGQEALQTPTGISTEKCPIPIALVQEMGWVFSPSADEFITWGDAGMLLSSVPLKLLLWNISPDCSLPSRELRADSTARPCSHLSTALRAAQGDLTLNHFHWLITGQNFALN